MNCGIYPSEFSAKISFDYLLTLTIVGTHWRNPDFSIGTVNDEGKRSCCGGGGLGRL